MGRLNACRKDLYQSWGRPLVVRLAPWWLKRHDRWRHLVSYFLLSFGLVCGLGGAVGVILMVGFDAPASWVLWVVLGLGWGLLGAAARWTRWAHLLSSKRYASIAARARELGWAVAKPHLLSHFDGWVIQQGWTALENAQKRAQKLEQALPPAQCSVAKSRERF